MRSWIDSSVFIGVLVDEGVEALRGELASIASGSVAVLGKSDAEEGMTAADVEVILDLLARKSAKAC